MKMTLVFLFLLLVLPLSNAVPMLRSRDLLFNKKHICRISVVDVEVIGPHDEKQNLLCDIVTDRDGISDYFFHIVLPEESIQQNKQAIVNHTWFIEYSIDQMYSDSHGVDNLSFHHPEEVITIPQQEVQQILNIANRRLEEGKSRRRLGGLANIVEEKTLVVVLFGDLTVSAEDVNRYIFGATDSLSSQIAGCSHSQTTLVPHPTHKIIRENARQNISLYSFESVYYQTLPFVKYKMGVWGSTLRAASDYYVYVVPDGIERNANEVGWATVYGHYFLVTESWIDSVQTTMHEIGHNFGNSHSFENGNEYADVSTVMGFAQRATKICFNGLNIWDMGWFVDRRLEIRDTDVIDTPQFVQLAFYGDYDKTTPSQPVVMKVSRDIFLTYNRKIGVNEDTGEFGDMLLVVQKTRGYIFSYSNLIAVLGEDGDQFRLQDHIDVGTNNNRNNEIIIQLCDRTDGDDEHPEFLTIAVSTIEHACDEHYGLGLLTDWPTTNESLTAQLP